MPEPTQTSEEVVVPSEGSTPDLSATVKSLEQMIVSQNATIAALQAAVEQKPDAFDEGYLEKLVAAQTAKVAIKPTQELDWDTMSASQLATNLLQVVEERIGKATAPVTERLTAAEAAHNELCLATNILATCQRHPEMEGWLRDKTKATAMAKLAYSNPRLAPEQLYELSAALFGGEEAKATLAKQREEEERKKRGEEARRAGSEKGGIPSGATQKRNITTFDAARQVAIGLGLPVTPTGPQRPGEE